MSADKLIRNDITFYLCDSNGKLKKNDVKLYSPFNVKTKGYESDTFDYVEPDFVLFEKWVYKLSSDLTSEKYDQFKEFLELYNNRWGKLTKGVGKSAIVNWKTVKGNGFQKVMTDYVDTEKAKETIVIEKVQIQTIPRVVAEWMDFAQLESLAKAWWVEIPTDIRESGKTNEIKENFLTILSEHLV